MKCKNVSKLALVTLIIFIISSLLPGCYDKREVDDLTYVIAIGFDKGKTNALRMTLQYAVPLAFAGGGGGGGGGGGESSKSLTSITLECPTIYSGLNMANNFIGKQVNLSHAKVVVFSEEVAKGGTLHDYIHAMIRGREFRPTINIAVSRGSAEDYINSVKPTQEADPAKYYELIYRSYKYTGFNANTQLHNFYFTQESLSSEPVATLVGVSKYKSENDFKSNDSDYAQKGRTSPLEGDYKAGNIPKTGDVNSELMGLAVFEGENMVGELDGDEATNYLMATGTFNYAFVTIPDPRVKNSYVVLNLKQSRNPVRKVDISSGKPEINLNLKLEADFLSIQSGQNYEEDNSRTFFESKASEFFKVEITNFLEKTAKELHSDICGFGRSVRGKFLTWKAWEDYNWLSRYKDSTFTVNVDLKVRRPGLIIRSIPAASELGKVE